MLEEQTIIAITTLIMNYCSGLGIAVEADKYQTLTTSAVCAAKIWKCSHTSKDTSTIAFNVHNCIGDHVMGKLK